MPEFKFESKYEVLHRSGRYYFRIYDPVRMLWDVFRFESGEYERYVELCDGDPRLPVPTEFSETYLDILFAEKSHLDVF